MLRCNPSQAIEAALERLKRTIRRSNARKTIFKSLVWQERFIVFVRIRTLCSRHVINRWLRHDIKTRCRTFRRILNQATPHRTQKGPRYYLPDRIRGSQQNQALMRVQQNHLPYLTLAAISKPISNARAAVWVLDGMET